MRYPIFRPTCPYTMKMLWRKRKLMVQRQGEQPNICPDDANEKQREKEKEYMANLALSPPPPGLLPLPPHPPVRALVSLFFGRGQTNPETASPFTIQQGSQFGQGVPTVGAGQCPLR